MLLTTRTRALSVAIALGLALAGCGRKDADITADAEKAVAGMQGVTVDVANGIATISGQFADSAAKTTAETAVKGVKGVKSVVDNATVTPPPAPVVISPDDSLKTNVTAALKGFPTLSADVKDGVVTLTGVVQRTALPKVMQALSALHPKKIQNKATVKR
ncbi:MAG: BON domain-containing protein [Gemmatimonadota bacterium]